MISNSETAPNKKEISLAADVLSRLEPGSLPFDIFQQIARVSVISITEFIPLRKDEDASTKVLLLEREPDDPHWPSMLHTPGAVVTPKDVSSSREEIIQRLLQRELPGATILGKPIEICSVLRQNHRGPENALLTYGELTHDSDISPGQWFDVNRLPDNTIEFQKEPIKLAVEAFNNSRSS